MCGICGFVSKSSIKIDILKKMNDTMFHRGPDDAGAELFEIGNGYRLGLAQRRLSILDLSELGHQPMHSFDKCISIVFNGEIYNFLELRKELYDYPFISNCDTEVIIAAYLKWGRKCVKKFNGMFAIALYDRSNNTLNLFRDRTGKKPLFYYWDGSNLIFASELKAIMSCPVFNMRINKEVLGQYLYKMCIAGSDSIFVNVHKLVPGEYLQYKEGHIKTGVYWDLKKRYDVYSTQQIEDYTEVKRELKDLLVDATKRRMISDVPLGTFLSGGYDSSLITAIAQSLSSEPIKTFSIGFEEKKYNEAQYAKAVANYLCTKHTEMIITENQMFELVQKIPYYYDEPFADSSQIPSMLVAQLAKKDVTVVLSGDGGDELFGGYSKYRKIKQLQKFDRLLMLLRDVASILKVEESEEYSHKINALIGFIVNKDERFETQILGTHYIKPIKKILTIGGESEYNGSFRYDESGIHARDWSVRNMLLDQMTYMTADILHKVDRATMASSLEARCPILDYRVQEFALRIPKKYKLNKKEKKYILKDIAYDYIPKKLLDRPKQGFSVPLGKWMRGKLREQLEEYTKIPYLKNQSIFNPEETHKWVINYLKNDKLDMEGYTSIVFAIFVFQMWWEKYVKDI